MIAGERIRLRGWQLVGTEFYNYRVYLDKRRVRCGEFYQEKSFNSVKQTAFMTVRVHQRSYKGGGVEEKITVRSIYFFDKGPFIQLWRSDDTPSFSQSASVNQPEWQKDFYKVIKIGDSWQRLEKNEWFLIHRIKESDIGSKTVIIKIIDKNKKVIKVSFQ